MSLHTKILFVSGLLFLHCSTCARAQEVDKGAVIRYLNESMDTVFPDPTSSLAAAEKAYEWSLTMQDDSLIAASLNRIGAAQWSLGNVILAIDRTYESLEVAVGLNYQLLLAANYENMGQIYGSAGLNLEAIGYFRREMNLKKSIGSEVSLFTSYLNLGASFINVSKYDSASVYLERALRTRGQGNRRLDLKLYYHLGQLAIVDGQLEKADSLIKVLYDFSVSSNGTRGLIRSNELWAELQLIHGDAEKALTYALSAVRIAEDSKVKELIYGSHKTLSKCYAGIGEYEKTYHHDLLYETYLDSVKNEVIVNELQLLEYRQRLFDTNVLRNNNELNRQVAEQRQLLNYVLIGILLISFFLIWSIMKRDKEISKQSRKLRELDEFKNKIFAIISHDLKSPIYSVSNMLELFYWCPGKK